MTQNREVLAFFDRIADGYTNRFDSQRNFHHYFFSQRLEKATEGFDFSGKSVLDVGAGTGPLYQLIKNAPGLDYYATDVSKAMLEQSEIPVERRFVADLSALELMGRAGGSTRRLEERELKLSGTALSFQEESFDVIYVLGVTSYLDRENCQKLLQTVGRLLKPEGTAVVSFTQSGSIDHYARMLLGWPVRLIRQSSAVMGQRFRINRYRPAEVRQLCGDQLRVQKVTYLNHTVFPFNRIFEKASVGMAEWMEDKLSKDALAKLSSDFLVQLKKR